MDQEMSNNADVIWKSSSARRKLEQMICAQDTSTDGKHHKLSDHSSSSSNDDSTRIRRKSRPDEHRNHTENAHQAYLNSHFTSELDSDGAVDLWTGRGQSALREEGIMVIIWEKRVIDLKFKRQCQVQKTELRQRIQDNSQWRRKSGRTSSVRRPNLTNRNLEAVADHFGSLREWTKGKINHGVGTEIVPGYTCKISMA